MVEPESRNKENAFFGNVNGSDYYKAKTRTAYKKKNYLDISLDQSI